MQSLIGLGRKACNCVSTTNHRATVMKDRKQMGGLREPKTAAGDLKEKPGRNLGVLAELNLLCHRPLHPKGTLRLPK